MGIRNVTKEDLPKMAALLNDEALATRSDICFEHSKMMFDDDGEILSFIIIKRYSLNDFFNGEVPMREYDKDGEDYVEGSEYWFKEMLDEYFMNDNQFELLYIYTRNHFYLLELYRHIRITEDGYALGLLWTTIQNPYMTEKFKESYFNEYNDAFLYDLLPYD